MPFDVGIGILLGLLLAPFSDNTSLNVYIGIALTLLPDMDGLIYYGSKLTGIGNINKKIVDHRDLFHYPLIYILFGSLIIGILNPGLIALFIAGSLVHFTHDSVGTGWGIPWLLPLSPKRFKFLYQYDLRKAGHPQKFVWVWSKTQQDQLIKNFGDPDWHKHTFQIGKYATGWKVGEILVLLVALTILISR